MPVGCGQPACEDTRDADVAFAGELTTALAAASPDLDAAHPEATAAMRAAWLRKARVFILYEPTTGALYYMPVVRTLVAGFREALGVIPQAYTPLPPPFRRADIVVWVGPAAAARAVLTRARGAGALVVYYSTEPARRCASLSDVAHEVWDYSLGNIEACAHEMAAAEAAGGVGGGGGGSHRRRLTLRFVPPGYVQPRRVVTTPPPPPPSPPTAAAPSAAITQSAFSPKRIFREANLTLASCFEQAVLAATGGTLPPG